MPAARYDLTDLKRKVLRERGLDCDRFKENFFLRRVEARMRHTGRETVTEYMRLLDRQPDEYGHLFDALSINVTQFFRDLPTFELIRRTVLPALVADKTAQGSRTLRIWSAGCATGEETYSLAILLAEALQACPRRMMAHVYGTDIDRDALAVARRGAYERKAMEAVARAYALRYFAVNSHYRVEPKVRDLARFKVHDLAKDPPLRFVDLLLCRNVMIYFGRNAQRRILEGFHAALRPGGYLVLGKTEGIGPELRGRFTLVDLKERVYRKPAEPSGLPRRS